jgi:hypothetical protein
MPKTHTVKAVEDKVDKADEPKIEEIIRMPKILSPPTKANLPKMQKASAATPKRRRMTNILDAVLETTKALSPAPAKKIAQAEAKSQAKAETGQAEAEATQAQVEVKAGRLGLQCSSRRSLPRLKKKRQSKLLLKRSRLLLPKL